MNEPKRGETFVHLNPETWDRVSISVWGTQDGPKILTFFERHTSDVMFSVPLQPDEAEVIGRALKGEKPT